MSRQITMFGEEPPARRTVQGKVLTKATKTQPAKASGVKKKTGKTTKKAPARKSGGGSKARGGGTKAHELAKSAREISVSEFFAKNRHLLGFDSKRKALLTTVKEAVDNALDACEEAGIVPDIRVTITPVKKKDEHFVVTIADNGPGILDEQIDLVFAKLLYGSKFHRLRQSRGQQGIGISAAGMYGQMTTGAPTVIRSRISKKHPVHEVQLRIDTTKNKPVRVHTRELEEWDREHGTEVSITLVGQHKKGRGSVEEYLGQVAVANPHMRLVYRGPDGSEEVHERATKQLPPAPKEIKPHPYGVELGTLMKMMKHTTSTQVSAFLQKDFSRVSAKVAKDICTKAKIDPTSRVKSLGHKAAEALHAAIPTVKIMNPPTDCLAPIGETLIEKGLGKEIGEAEFFVSRTRSPSVYRGNPFQVEVGVALGGELSADDPVRVMRFANRVPLQYQPGACAITKAVTSVDWKSYGLQQPRGSLPVGPAILMVHIASAWVPFTSESKEAVASYPEILKELKLALQECGRKMQTYLRKKRRIADEMKKRSYIDKYIPHIGEALRDILELDETKTDQVVAELRDTLERSRKM